MNRIKKLSASCSANDVQKVLNDDHRMSVDTFWNKIFFFVQMIVEFYPTAELCVEGMQVLLDGRTKWEF